MTAFEYCCVLLWEVKWIFHRWRWGWCTRRYILSLLTMHTAVPPPVSHFMPITAFLCPAERLDLERNEWKNIIWRIRINWVNKLLFLQSSFFHNDELKLPQGAVRHYCLSNLQLVAFCMARKPISSPLWESYSFLLTDFTLTLNGDPLVLIFLKASCLLCLRS